MTHAQKKALQFIALYDGVYARDIGMHLDRDLKPTVAGAKGAGIVWKLVRAGLVRARVIPNERVYAYHVTKAGRDALERAEQ